LLQLSEAKPTKPAQEIRMRVCRFGFDEMVLTGFYADQFVIPLDQAAEAYSRENGVELLLPATEDLLELLPPDGSSYDAACELDAWIERLDVFDRDELTIPVSDVRLLVPIAAPPKLLFLAGNYAKHVAERGGTLAERYETFPYVFMKPPSTTLTNPGDPIILPQVSPNQIDWECELGVVIGRRCRRVDEDEAMSCIGGYTIVNDISDRNFKPNPGRKPRERDKFFDWMHGKWHDTFCPMGPCILSADAVPDPQALSLRLTVNGEIKQDGTTGEMIFPVGAVIAFLSEFVTLEPGDVIATGTPSGVGSATGTFLRPGDLVRATISQIGTLENPVEAEEEP
jgi:2-keto-4-pentenoate hydratase/2-oxohepta-3-ene-1,7-dioic acid hydratase in catechol pathway